MTDACFQAISSAVFPLRLLRIDRNRTPSTYESDPRCGRERNEPQESSGKTYFPNVVVIRSYRSSESYWLL